MADEHDSGSGNGAGNGSGSDWIRAWVEQQREQLRRASRAADQSTDNAAAGKAHAQTASDAIKDLGLRWLEAGQSYLRGWSSFAQRSQTAASGAEPLQFGEEMFASWQQAWVSASAAGEGASRQFADLLARMPALGLAREQTETWRELMDAQAQCQLLEQELRAVWTQVQNDALSLLETRLRERPQPYGVSDYRELYDLWVECGEKVFAKVAHSEAYAKLQAQVGNAVMRLRAKQQAVIERGLKHFDLPTRAELNTVHKQMRELRERIAMLEAQLGAPSDARPEQGREGGQ